MNDYKSIVYTAVFVLLLTFSIYAHGDHEKKGTKKPDTLTIVGNDTIAINGIPVGNYKNKKAAEEHLESEILTEAEETGEISIDTLFEHVHNKVIHFPIALSVIGFLLMIAGYKNGKYSEALKLIIPFAAFMGIIAVLSGLNQADPFEGTAKYELVETHELLGFAVLASLVLWSLALYVKSIKKVEFIIALITVILISIAGFYGGIIAH